MKKCDYYVVVLKDEDGFFFGEVPQIKACYSQGHSLQELLENMKEVICLNLRDDEADPDASDRFVGVQRVIV